LVALGVLIAAATYVKPVGHSLILAPIVPLALATRSLRQTVIGAGIVAGIVVVATVPWMARNAAQYGSFTMSAQTGSTLFARVFEHDGLPVPLDRPYGRQLQDLMRQHPDVRPSSGFHDVLRGLGLGATEANGVQRDLALTAFERDPVTVAGGVVDSVAAAYTNVAGDDGHGREVMDTIVEERESAIPSQLTALGLGIGEGLRGLWFLISINGFAAILWFLAAGLRARIAASCVVAVWVSVALATAVLHGGQYRYSASLAPLVWLFGALGGATVLRLAAQFCAPPWRNRLLALTTRGLAPRKAPGERQPSAGG
jgi:hypothetical protein